MTAEITVASRANSRVSRQSAEQAIRACVAGRSTWFPRREPTPARKIWRSDEAKRAVARIDDENEGDVYSAGSNDFLRRNIPDLESLIPAIERLERWERALMDLTPGGSEFVGEPETCAKFVSDRLATVIRLQRRVMELEQGIKDAVQKL